MNWEQPDHDNFTYITNQINDLLTDNNKKYATNSELFQTVERLSTAIKTLTGHEGTDFGW